MAEGTEIGSFYTTIGVELDPASAVVERKAVEQLSKIERAYSALTKAAKGSSAEQRTALKSLTDALVREAKQLQASIPQLDGSKYTLKELQEFTAQSARALPRAERKAKRMQELDRLARSRRQDRHAYEVALQKQIEESTIAWQEAQVVTVPTGKGRIGSIAGARAVNLEYAGRAHGVGGALPFVGPLRERASDAQLEARMNAVFSNLGAQIKTAGVRTSSSSLAAIQASQQAADATRASMERIRAHWTTPNLKSPLYKNAAGAGGRGFRFNPSMGGAVLGGLQSLAMGGGGMTGLGAMAGGAIGGAFGPLGGMLGAGVGQTIGSLTQSIADLGRTVIDTGSKFEQLQMRLRGLEGSNAPKVFKDLVNTSKELAMPISEVTEQYVRLSAYGLKPAMADLEALVSYTRMIGEGKNVEFLGLALSQIAAKGKVEMQELRQLAERGFPALEVLVSKMKIPLSDIGDIGKKMIPSDEVLRVFFQEMERRSKVAAEVYATTLEGKLANLKTTWEMLLAGVSPTGDVNNPLLESYKGVVDSLRSLLESQGFRSLLEDTIQGMAALLDMVNGMVNATPAQRAKGLLLGSVTMGGGAAAYYAKIGREEREAAAQLRRMGFDPTGKPLAKRTTGGAGMAPIYGMGATPTNLYAGLAEMMQTSGMGGGAATSSVASLIKQLERINLDVARIQDPKFLQAEREKWQQQVAAGTMLPADFEALTAAQTTMAAEAPQLGKDLADTLLSSFRQDYMRQIETLRVGMDESAKAALDFAYSIEDLDKAMQLAPEALKPLIQSAKDATKAAYEERRVEAGRQAMKSMASALSGKFGGQLGGQLDILNQFEQAKQWMNAGISKTLIQQYMNAMASNVQPYRPTEALQYGSAAEYSARMSSQIQTTNEILKSMYEQLRDIAERQAAGLGLELPVAL